MSAPRQQRANTARGRLALQSYPLPAGIQWVFNTIAGNTIVYDLYGAANDLTLNGVPQIVEIGGSAPIAAALTGTQLTLTYPGPPTPPLTLEILAGDQALRNSTGGTLGCAQQYIPFVPWPPPLVPQFTFSYTSLVGNVLTLTVVGGGGNVYSLPAPPFVNQSTAESSPATVVVGSDVQLTWVTAPVSGNVITFPPLTPQLWSDNGTIPAATTIVIP